jgi:hypothetical protein
MKGKTDSILNWLQSKSAPIEVLGQMHYHRSEIAGFQHIY